MNDDPERGGAGRGEPSEAAPDEAESGEITDLLHAVERGDRSATDRLFEAVYEELRRIARRQLGAGGWAETLSTTALVHEAYLKLSLSARWTAENRRHFFALAARAMRHLVVDHARRRGRQKRGGGQALLDVDEHQPASPQRPEELVALDEALARLERAEPELAQLVEWRFFAGLSIEEIAELAGVSDRTIKRRWRLARALLYRDLEDQGLAP
jgi:RNA polymerase sigma factor (TIGR02999 family)